MRFVLVGTTKLTEEPEVVLLKYELATLKFEKASNPEISEVVDT